MKQILRSCLASSLLAASAFGATLATIDSGRISGTQFGTSSGEVMFLGIPYAAPPTGGLRWKPPQPVARWSRVRKADTFATACPAPDDDVRQTRGDFKEYAQTLPYYKEFRTSEDCLFINVWTANLGGKPKLPVMVWIHGGGGVAGTGQVPPFGPGIARRGVVLASIDFRIGVFGDLAHPALSVESPQHASGNYGALDQIAALQWIRRNIAVFGGDPDNVTIFGHSNGGTQVCVLMASPLARGLFQRAILESEVCTSGILPELKRPLQYEGSEKAATAEDSGLRLARDLHIVPGPQALAQLRAKSVDEVMQASHRLDIYTNPTVDGWVLTEQPAVSFRNGRQARVPVIVGSTDQEMAFNYSAARDPATLAAYKQYLQIYRFEPRAADFLRLYPAHEDADVKTAFLSVETDDIGQGAYFFARQTARAGQKAYLYYFTYPGRGKTMGLGAIHGSELKFLTGVFRKSWWGEPNEEDKKLFEIVSGYWTRFAATGDPNEPGLPSWPAYDPRVDVCLEVGHEVKARPIPHKDKYLVFEEALKARLESQ